ncbi:hypothetical protein [Haloplanus halobius]|uniref:hypothetical protein n=1 Tax=Haloplanus halobius TaxID=2934938 RepID=UPI00200D8529|nr:hypothetical protein [Haloplanus sp. XH21]
MKAVPSYTVDRETAATLREWLFENAVEKHGESAISEPLAELAAAIDGVLYEEAEAVELGAWAQTVSPRYRDASHVDGAQSRNPNQMTHASQPSLLLSMWAPVSQIASTTRFLIQRGSSITSSP